MRNSGRQVTCIKKSLIERHGKMQKQDLREASSKRGRWEQMEVLDRRCGGGGHAGVVSRTGHHVQ